VIAVNREWVKSNQIFGLNIYKPEARKSVIKSSCQITSNVNKKNFFFFANVLNKFYMPICLQVGPKPNDSQRAKNYYVRRPRKYLDSSSAMLQDLPPSNGQPEPEDPVQFRCSKLVSEQVSISSTFYSAFLYKSALGSFFLITVWLCNFLAQEYRRKSCS